MTNEPSTAVQDPDANQERYRSLDPNQVLSVIPLLPYHEVADIGAGTGYFTLPLGKHLFDGRVVAIEDDQASLDKIQQQLDAIRLTNVTLGKTSRGKLPMEDSSVDGALIAFHVHELSNARKTLEEVHRCLRSGGWLVVIEWNKRDPAIGPAMERRTDVNEMREMLESVGFRFTSRHDLNSRQYMLIHRK